MLALNSKVTQCLTVGSVMPACDNSGAKMVKITSVMGYKGVKGRKPQCGVGSLVMCVVKKGRPDMRKQVTLGVVVRQKKEFQRPNGTRIKFEDNAIVILKDDKGNPKGTTIKGAIAKEVCKRWPAIAKIASIIV